MYSNGLTDEGSGTDCAPNKPTGNDINYVNGVESGEKWQCAKLVNRPYLTEGWINKAWRGNAGQPLWNSTPTLLSKQANGSVSYLGPGDVVVINVYLKGKADWPCPHRQQRG